MEQKTIKIFLASSNELNEDRVWFGDFVQGIDKIYQERGKGVDVFKWEFFDAANNDRSKQGEYDEEIRTSDMFLALFHTKAGKFTLHEYDVAMEEYRKSKKFPKVYVYLKALQEGEEETPELKDFKAGLSKKGKEYFWITYSTRDQLHLHFLQQLLRVENSLDKLKYEEGKVTLEGIHVADIDNLPFAKENKDYQRISAELLTLPREIDGARQFLNEHPDNDYMRGELQKKINHYNDLKEEFARLQKTLFDTSQRIAKMQREQLSDKLRRAAEAFECGNLDGANALLDEIGCEADTHYEKMKQSQMEVQRYSELVHQDIEAFLLRAKTVMAEVNMPIEERIKQVQDIYAKADEWAKDSALPDEKYEGLLRDYSDFLYNYGLYKEAEPIHLRLIDLREKLYGKDHADTATSYNNLGVVYNSQGNYDKALKYLGKALDIRERVSGIDHLDTAQSYNNIGFVYYDQGDYDKALEYLRKALEIHKRLLGPDHPDTATSYNNIGAVYRSQGDYAKALEYYRKDLAICERLLGPDHPSTAGSYNNIGHVYYSQGDYLKAFVYYKKALAIKERVLGSDHPSTATSYNNIAGFYYNQGEYAKALKYLGKTLAIWERVLGPDHPDTKTVMENMIICLEEMQG